MIRRTLVCESGRHVTDLDHLLTEYQFVVFHLNRLPSCIPGAWNLAGRIADRRHQRAQFRCMDASGIMDLETRRYIDYKLYRHLVILRKFTFTLSLLGIIGNRTESTTELFSYVISPILQNHRHAAECARQLILDSTTFCCFLRPWRLRGVASCTCLHLQHNRKKKKIEHMRMRGHGPVWQRHHGPIGPTTICAAMVCAPHACFSGTALRPVSTIEDMHLWPHTAPPPFVRGRI